MMTMLILTITKSRSLKNRVTKKPYLELNSFKINFMAILLIIPTYKFFQTKYNFQPQWHSTIYSNFEA